MSDLTFTHEDTQYPFEEIIKALSMMETSGGTNIKERYEPKYHNQMLLNYKRGKWQPTPAEMKAIKKYGFDKATKLFSTSRGEFQVLPETAYRYTSFNGDVYDLDNPEIQKQVVSELWQRAAKKSGGDLKKATYLWNQGGDYFPKFLEYLNQK